MKDIENEKADQSDKKES